MSCQQTVVGFEIIIVIYSLFAVIFINHFFHFFSVGIANSEEFSLLVEGQKEDKEDADKMGTIKRVCCLIAKIALSLCISVHASASGMCSFDSSLVLLTIHVQVPVQVHHMKNKHECELCDIY